MILPFEPYNQFFISCVENNLLGILTLQDQVASQLPARLLMNYSVHTPRIPSEQVAEELLVEGKFMLQVETSGQEQIRGCFRQVPISLDEFDSVHDAIAFHLQNGGYVFLELDRFYFPNTFEHGKQHRFHLTFLFGFDEQTQTYLYSDDAALQGIMGVHRLEKEVFEQALVSVQASKTPIGYANYLKPDWQLAANVSREDIKQNLQALLSSQLEAPEATQGDGVIAKYSGLQSLERFSEIFLATFPKIDMSLSSQQVASARPSTLQKKNIHTLNILYEQNILTPSQKESLEASYQELLNLWENYKYSIFKYINYTQMKATPAMSMRSIAGVPSLLTTLYQKETDTTQRFLEYLK